MTIKPLLAQVKCCVSQCSLWARTVYGEHLKYEGDRGALGVYRTTTMKRWIARRCGMVFPSRLR